MRGTRHEEEARLSECLQLSSALDRYFQRAQPIAQASELAAEWSGLAGNLPVLLLRSVQRARRLVLATLGLGREDALLLAANSSYTLVETLKQAGMRPTFVALSPRLSPESHTTGYPLWQEIRFGLPTGLSTFGASHLSPVVVDCADSVPTGPLSQAVQMGIFGCHLSARDEESGALIVFANQQQWQLAQSLLHPKDHLSPAQEVAARQQAQRLQALIPAQQQGLQQVATGVALAAGLPQMDSALSFVLAHGIAVEIPAECDPATFVIYAKGENTPLQWLAEIAPIHPAAIAHQASTSQHLARWLLLPVNPHYDDGLADQAVLGVVKAAEYLGVRWRTDPQRAGAYAALLTEMYGPDHDAYRPSFATGLASPGEVALLRKAVQPTACRIL